MIRKVEEQDSPRFVQYQLVLDDIFRKHGTQMLGAVGFVCYLAFNRTFPKNPVRTEHHWFRGLSDKASTFKDLNQEKAESILARRYTGTLWLSHLRGQRHDYFFYSRGNIEEILDLVEVAKVMIS